MAKSHGRNFDQLLKSFNLIYICLGRFLYAVGPFRLRFYLHPACSHGTKNIGGGVPNPSLLNVVQAGRTENRNLAETPVLDGISTHENPAKAQLHITCAPVVFRGTVWHRYRRKSPKPLFLYYLGTSYDM